MRDSPSLRVQCLGHSRQLWGCLAELNFTVHPLSGDESSFGRLAVFSLGHRGFLEEALVSPT